MPSICELKSVYDAIRRVEHSNVSVSTVKRVPDDRGNPRDNAKAVPVVAKSLRDFGYVKTSITVDENWEILTGDTTYQAHHWNANLRKNERGLSEEEYIKAENRFDADDWDTIIQVTQIMGMSDWMKRAYRIADNKSHEFADWRPDMVIRDLEFIQSRGMDVSMTSFSPRELAQLVKSVPDMTAERKVSPINSSSIEDYEIDSDDPSGDSEIVHEQRSSIGDDLPDGGCAWIVHLAFSTKEMAEEFVRKNGFDIEYQPNSRMLSIDMSEVK